MSAVLKTASIALRRIATADFVLYVMFLCFEGYIRRKLQLVE